MSWCLRVYTLSLIASAACACSLDASSPVEARPAAIIYDHDERQELFQLGADPARALVASSVVAFIPREELIDHGTSMELLAAPRSELDGLCSDERFAEQPAAAVCSGVLVDWDLVLTASHCVRALAISGLAAVFGYYYDAPGAMALDPADVYGLREVVAQSIETRDGHATLDYAFVRLERPVDWPRAPAPLRTSLAGAQVGAALISAGASEGIPIKVDRGGAIRALRLGAYDHFVADTDTAHGGSGGAAFDADLALLGVLFRGGEDRIASESCERENRVGSELADERFSYAARALGDLCGEHPDASSLCRADCGDPCRALAPTASMPAGCALAPRARSTRPGTGWLASLSALALVCARARRRVRLTTQLS